MNFFKSFAVILFVFCMLQLASEAKTYVMHITPTQTINLRNGQIKVDDILDFCVVDDITRNGEVYIAKDTPVKATVKHVEDDAWVGDSDLLELSHFETTDVNGNPVVFDYSLKIKGRYGITKAKDYIKYSVKSLFFYANLDFKPGSVIFNVLFDD